MLCEGIMRRSDHRETLDVRPLRRNAIVQNCGKGGPEAVANVRPLAGDRAGCRV